MAEADLNADILIIGASFAGIELIYRLVHRFDGRPPTMLVVDRQEAHGYIPLVHERMCRRLEHDRSTLNTAEVVNALAQATFVHDTVVAFDPAERRATLASGRRCVGRFVVLAIGSDAVKPEPLPSIANQLVSYKFDRALESARDALAACLTSEPEPQVTVVGGGVSGVELAGELADLRRLRPEGWHAPTVTLVSASDRLLPSMPRRLGRKVASRLVRQGVAVRLSARVASVHAEGLTLRESGVKGDEPVELATHVSFWAAGLQPAPVIQALGVPLTDDGWIAVGPTLQCFPHGGDGVSQIFACGDAVRIIGGEGRWNTMQRAIECIWQAQVVANAIHAWMNERAVVPHRLREHFPYGISLGAHSLVVYRGLSIDVPRINIWFRRWLMRQYFARYRGLVAR